MNPCRVVLYYKVCITKFVHKRFAKRLSGKIGLSNIWNVSKFQQFPGRMLLIQALWEACLSLLFFMIFTNFVLGGPNLGHIHTLCSSDYLRLASYEFRYNSLLFFAQILNFLRMLQIHLRIALIWFAQHARQPSPIPPGRLTGTNDCLPLLISLNIINWFS